jgi:hypothetical protein
MFGMLSAVLKQRRQNLQQQAEEPNADGPLDAMQVLIDEGCSDNDIVQVRFTLVSRSKATANAATVHHDHHVRWHR